MPYWAYENWRAKGHRATVHWGTAGTAMRAKAPGAANRSTTDDGMDSLRLARTLRGQVPRPEQPSDPAAVVPRRSRRAKRCCSPIDCDPRPNRPTKARLLRSASSVSCRRNDRPQSMALSVVGPEISDR